MTIATVSYPFSRRLLRQSSSSSTSSCISVNRQSKPASISLECLQKEAQHFRRKRFCIEEEENEVYFNRDSITDEEIEAAWYTDEDFDKFRSEAAGLVNEILDKCTSPRSWPSAIQQTYETFIHARNVKDVEHAVAVSNVTILDHLRGFELYMLCMTDRRERHDRLQEQIRLWQDSGLVDCEEDMRLASRHESRTDRLFAYHIAKVSMEDFGRDD